MAIVLPAAFDPIGVFGSAEIAAEKIMGADEWAVVVANDAYIRSETNRRRFIDYADTDDPIALEQSSLSTTRFFELARTRVRLSDGRDAAIFDWDLYKGEVRVAHLDPSAMTLPLGIAPGGGGSGYSALDVLTLVGGTGTAATVEVATVGGSGDVLTVNPVIVSGGNYTAFPRSCVVGHGPETIVDGGSGYIVGELLTVVGGTGTAATFVVGAVTGGVITSFSAHSYGDYTVSPREVVATTSGGAGTGCQLLLDWGDSATRYCSTTGGAGTGAILDVSRRIITSQSATSTPSRTQGTLNWPTLLSTEYDLVVEGRNTVAPGDFRLYAMRYREQSITLADL